ncbi:FAD/FMN-containing dehydrogenase [Rhodanobacter sp. ANJX3]|uniref:FAD-binding oxidoreductase n=1 Tax=Rhodanobacter sp. ANJX3 TaxID=2723083 RepID=UPI001612A199|nr:FAD-binding oxidoreductase [Rhodanobacter sp. ANJX3]MBB5358726.1 FAD/FMN-containing dehydrogenase [Rhodanobacter sp. ANJX3]
MSTHPLAELRQRLPELRVLTEPGDLEHYGRDWTRRWTPAPLAIALPASIDEVQAIVRWANDSNIALVPSGGRTGLSGGAVAANGELVLSLERMNRVLDFNAVDRTLTVQPGITLQAVHDASAEHGLLYPVDFAARGSCSIGGNIATNAGGIRVIRYGNTREWIASLKVVAGNGELIEFNRGLIKNSSGYDFRQLMIGSEGTLGIVVEATLKLTDRPLPSQVMLLALPDMDALMQVFALFRAQLSLQAFEFFTDRALHHVLAHGAQRAIEGEHPYYVVTQFDAVDENTQELALATFEQAVEKGWVSDGVLAQSDAQAAALWRLREGITESLAPHRPYKNDVSVKVSTVPAFLHEMQALLAHEYPHIEVVWFGHIGDGNLHINVLRPDDLDEDAFIAQCEHVTKLLAATLKNHGGSISAEHGIGLVKRAYLESTRDAAEILLMKGVRKVFDPRGILNPGKLFTDG